MPELPEVETIASGLNRRVAGEQIESVWLGSKPEPLKSPAAEIVAALEGARIERVRRVGKHIVVDLAHTTAKGNPQWVIQLGMTGNLLITEPSAAIAKHTHVILRLESGRELRFVDPRRFGRLSVVPGRDHGQTASGFTGPGTEPLTISAHDF